MLHIMTTPQLINEMRMQAEDLHSVNGHSPTAAALSEAADRIEAMQVEIQRLRDDVIALQDARKHCCGNYRE